MRERCVSIFVTFSKETEGSLRLQFSSNRSSSRSALAFSRMIVGSMTPSTPQRKRFCRGWCRLVKSSSGKTTSINRSCSTSLSTRLRANVARSLIALVKETCVGLLVVLEEKSAKKSWKSVIWCWYVEMFRGIATWM